MAFLKKQNLCAEKSLVACFTTAT